MDEFQFRRFIRQQTHLSILGSSKQQPI